MLSCSASSRRRRTTFYRIGKEESRETTKIEQVLSVLLVAVLHWCSHLSRVRCAFVSRSILLYFAEFQWILIHGPYLALLRVTACCFYSQFRSAMNAPNPLTIEGRERVVPHHPLPLSAVGESSMDVRTGNADRDKFDQQPATGSSAGV